MSPAAGPPVLMGLNAVILAVTDERPRLLTLSEPDGGSFAESLPFDALDPKQDRTLELGLLRIVREQIGLELGYVEQLYTFGDRFRDGLEFHGGPRVVSAAYLAFVHERRLEHSHPRARWRDWYEFFPWEDWRDARPAVIDEVITPALVLYAEQAGNRADGRQREERGDIAFGLGGASWDGDRVLERYELLYELGLVAEAHRDVTTTPPPFPSNARLGSPMAVDHRRILATALGRMRGKIKYRPVVFELLPPTFTLLQLQRLVEALGGGRLHKGNFRRLVEAGGLVEGTGRYDDRTGGRPAEIFRFRREVLRERRAPGVGPR